MNKIKSHYLLILLLCSLASFSTLTAQTVPLRSGKHNLSLQWISWEKMGTVDIGAPDRNGVRNVKGSQRSDANDDYLEIEGTLSEGSARELIFKGTIRSKVAGVNNGQLCEREGTYHFKATGKRKYWRLQEMDNCEGNRVTDYVDIYF